MIRAYLEKSCTAVFVFPESIHKNENEPVVAHLGYGCRLFPMRVFWIRVYTRGESREQVECVYDDHRARATPATARRPAATDPTFLVAAPVNLALDGLVAVPVAAGAMGEPVAAGEEAPGAPGDPGLPGEAGEVPVATGAVPVANPVEPATADELRTGH